MIWMNDAKRARISLDQYITENRETRKYRMTYEHAGHIFRALQFIPAALAIVSLAEVDEMRLIPPDKNMKFAEWLDFNSHKLQLFDTPKKLTFVRSSGFIHASKWPDEVAINPDLDKWEYTEEL